MCPVRCLWQAAQDAALSTGDSEVVLKILEAAGDLFFNSSQDRHKAIPFYRVPVSSAGVGVPLTR